MIVTGHTFGDRVLGEVSRRIDEDLRSNDVLGRHGGEEFALFLPGVGGERALRIADRLREAVSELSFIKTRTR